MEQQNARLATELSIAFAKTVMPLLDVHRGAAEQALGPGFVVAKAQPLPPAAQASPADSSADSSGSAYAKAQENVIEGTEPMGMNAGAEEPNWVEELHDDVGKNDT